jgi:hypothetical protein
MVTKYSVIQFTPDAISGERINIGVIVFDKDRVRTKFLANWKRVRSFAGVEVGFLKELAEELQAPGQLILPGMGNGPQLNENLIEEIIAKWANSIQFTPARTSLKSLDELLDSATAQFLMEPTTQERKFRDRRSAIKIAKDSIRKALEEHIGKEEAEKFLHPQREIEGKFGPHVFDVVVGNGLPQIAIQGISFELPEATQLDQLTNAVAFQIFDTRERYKKLQIGILALPPKPYSPHHVKEIYERAQRTYKGLNAHVIGEQYAEAWARVNIKQASLVQ